MAPKSLRPSTATWRALLAALALTTVAGSGLSALPADTPAGEAPSPDELLLAAIDRDADQGFKLPGGELPPAPEVDEVVLPPLDGAEEPLFDGITPAAELVDVPVGTFELVVERNGVTTGDLERLLHDDTLHVDRDGRMLYLDRFSSDPDHDSWARAMVRGGEEPGSSADDSGVSGSTITADQDPFKLHSKPGSKKTIYLDFDGHTLTGTYWNDNHPDPFLLRAPSWSSDSARSADMTSVWRRVAEDFAPFDVDVTTEDPGYDAINRSSSADDTYGTRLVITGMDIDRFCPNDCNGIAYVGTFNVTSSHDRYQPAMCEFGSPKIIADCASHEIGHTLGLHHDGQLGGVEYYGGHGPWGPLMGTPTQRPITQWSKGEYAGANNTQDDLAVMAQHGAAGMVDDHSNTTATATPLFRERAQTGIISSEHDIDTFALTPFSSGMVTITAPPAPVSANLDIELTLLDATGQVLAIEAPPVVHINDDIAIEMGAVITHEVTAGATYYVQVSGGAYLEPHDGYSEYGSIGAFQISVAGDPAACPAPVITERQLDAAIVCANTSAVDTITLGADIALTESTRVLDTDDPAHRVRIEGNGHTVDGGGVAEVRPFQVADETRVTFDDLTVTGGSHTLGGGLLSFGVVSVVDSTFSGNSAAYGAALWARRGSLTVTGSTISGNDAMWHGGGIGVDREATVTVMASTVAGNTAGATGGGLYALGPLTLVNSTVSGNASTDSGGGAHIDTGTLTSINSTVSGNGSPAAGGIRNDHRLVMSNTLVAGNSGGDCHGWAAEGGHNLVQDTGASACGLDDGVDGNLIGHDPLLGPLQDNGGPTLTSAPGRGSPAIDAGDNAAAVLPLGGALNTDQRGIGFRRVIIDQVDIGAVEHPCPTFPVTVRGEEDLHLAIGCFNDTSDPGEHRITLTGDIALTESTPVIDHGDPAASLRIDGNGHRVDGGSIVGVRPFEVAEATRVVFEDVTVTGGNLTQGSGGGLLSRGVVSVVGSTFRGNSAHHGGGLSLSGGHLTMTDSTIGGNAATLTGGGIHVISATVTLTGSTVEANTAGFGGGGLATAGAVTVVNSTVSGNLASGWGVGGGVSTSGTLTVTNSTISDNDGVGGGGISNTGTMRLANTVVAGNRGGDCRGEAATAGHTLIEDTGESACGLDDGVDGNLIGHDPLLGLLRDNGGPTRTHRPDGVSPAIDAGDNALAVDPQGDPLGTDQRGEGFPRVINDIVDIGAVESCGFPFEVGNEHDLSAAIECFNDQAVAEGERLVTLSADIALTTSTPTIRNTTAGMRLRIDGDGHAIDGGGTAGVRPFHVAADTTVDFEDVVIRGGRGHGTGGGLLSEGTVTVSDSVVSGNGSAPETTGGGGIAASGEGELTVIDSTLSGNAAGHLGGGAIRSDSGTVTITGTQVTGNSAAGRGSTVEDVDVAFGGGIGVFGGTATITDTTIDGNTLVRHVAGPSLIIGGGGGGVYVGNPGTVVTITRSTISDNTAPTGDGGGVLVQSGSDTTLVNSTVADNGSYPGLTGPGVKVDQAVVTLTNSTIADRTRISGIFQMANSILVGPCDGSPSFGSRGSNNLLADASCGLVHGVDGNLVGVDPGLDPDGLQDNGGPTRTIALLDSSPAVDAGSSDLARDVAGQALTTDQRSSGFSRVLGDRVDIGAVERACPATAGDEADLRAVIDCFNTITEPGEHRVSLTDDIALTASTPAIANRTAGVSLRLDGAGHAVDGGGIVGVRPFEVAFGATAVIADLTVRGGNVAGYGGGISNRDGTLTLLRSTVSANRAGASGGGIDNSGTLTVVDSTIRGNTAVLGGGIHQETGALTVINTTVSGNSAVTVGDGLYHQGGPVTVRNSTFSGDGVSLSGSEAVLANTIIDGGTCFADSITGGHNLISEPFNACELSDGVDGNLIGRDPLLGPLQDNGGPTLTHALGRRSPAVDAGDNAAAVDAQGNPLGTDQRGDGFPRVINDVVDIGAFELDTPPDTTPPVITADIDGTEGDAGWYRSDVTVTWTVTDDESAITATDGCDPTTLDNDTAEAILTCEATSEGGTTSESVTIARDATAPLVAVTGVADGATYVLGEVPEAGCATDDATSGVATAATLTTTGDDDGIGNHTATCDGATDTAGNPQAASVSVSYTVTPPPDDTPPVITVDVDGTVGDAGWYRSDVTVTWTVTDDESAITATDGCDPTTLDNDTAEAILTCEATSEGGTTSESVTIARDATAPLVAVTGVADGATYVLGEAPEAGCATDDATSGVATDASLSLAGGGDDGTGTYTVTCDGATDTAGNPQVDPATVSYSVLPERWDPATTYEAGDRVSHDGTVYEARWWTRGQEPGTSPNGAWAEIAEAEDGTAIWTASRVFNAGDVVVHQGARYEALHWTQGEEPGTSATGAWQEIAEAEDGTAIWTASRVFDTGDVVIHDGVRYQARWWNRNQPPGDPRGPWRAID